jgi:hypothetical protein
MRFSANQSTAGLNIEIPNEAIATKHSASGNIHRLARPSRAVLVLEPGRKLWIMALLILAVVPVVWGVCIFKRAATELTVGLSLMPLIGAFGVAVGGFCFHRFGTRVRFDCDLQRVTITGARHAGGLHYSFSDIAAVQFCDAGIKQGDGAWHAYQVNLVIGGAAPTRINLLDSGGRTQLQAMAKEIAEFLGVPFYIGSHAA